MPLATLALALTLGVAGAGPTPARSKAPPYVVVVDPGHGGEQDGALAPSGEREADLALAIARRASARLKKAGVRVVLTRTGDISVPLANRAAVANALRADLFLSIHLNSMPTAEQRRTHAGLETYFLSADASDASATAVAARENADRLAGEPDPDPDDPVAAILDDLSDQASLEGASRLAYALHDRLVTALGAEDRGVKQAPFYVLAGARMPAVLLELGFISHPEESAHLRDPAYQDRIAAAIVEGVAAFRSQGKRAGR